jgi:hypothetical protein
MIVHFVGFKIDEQLQRAIRVFGSPTYVHPTWDVRAEQEYAEGDVIIYANKTPERIQDHPNYKDWNLQ